MKLNKTAVLASLGLLAAGTQVKAQNNVFITGATSFRTQIYASLHDLGLGVNNGATTGANTFSFSGTISTNTVGFVQTGDANASSVNVYVALLGTAEGIATLAYPTTNTPSYGTGITAPTYGADLAFSEVDQASTTWGNVGLHQLSSADGIASSYGAGIAVNPYLWAASADAKGLISNITPEDANDLFANGLSTLNFWQGTAQTPVYLTGRGNDAGPRIILQTVSGWDPSVPIDQYALNGTVASVPTSGGTWEDVGNVGYSSGNNVAKALANTGTGLAVGYFAFQDAASLGSGGGAPISYEGVSPTTSSTWVANSTPWNLAGVENGSYILWTYSHLYETSSSAATATFAKSRFAPDLLHAVLYEIVHPGIYTGTLQTADLIGNLQVHRNSDGGPIESGN